MLVPPLRLPEDWNDRLEAAHWVLFETKKGEFLATPETLKALYVILDELYLLPQTGLASLRKKGHARAVKDFQSTSFEEVIYLLTQSLVLDKENVMQLCVLAPKWGKATLGNRYVLETVRFLREHPQASTVSQYYLGKFFGVKELAACQVVLTEGVDIATETIPTSLSPKLVECVCRFSAEMDETTNAIYATLLKDSAHTVISRTKPRPSEMLEYEALIKKWLETTCEKAKKLQTV